MQPSTPSGLPYPGLRPFEAEEAHLFFGREQQVDALLERLHASRLVAVVGESGAGKSSLVRAGLLPALEAGFLAEAGSDWRFVVMRPGGAPLDALTDELLAPGILSDSGGKPERDFAGAELRRGPLGLVQLVKDAHLPAHTNLLLVVDQFEELFRYNTLSHKGEAEAFVELLLRSVSQREMPIYVVLTMRSDFIGECARFRGLPEALNDNQFLTPRLTREQISLAIRGPARVFGGDVEDVLIAELANEVGDDPDQLPLLQHLLMRLWEQAVCRQSPPILTLALYRELGGFRAALNQHAEQIYMELTPEGRALAQKLFKCLCGSPGGRRDVRRPARVREVLAAADVEMGTLVKVVEAFRGPGRHFLMPPSSVALGPDTQLDISHESLVRQWQRLEQWVDEEAANAREFLGLRDEAVRWKAGNGELILGRDLSRALDWRQRVNPTAAWAERYAPTVEYEAVMAYISESETEANRQRDEKQAVLEREAAAATKLRGLSWVLGVLFVAAGAAGGYAWYAKQAADEQRNLVVAQKLVADAMAEIATDPGAALHRARDAVQANPSDSLADMTLRRAIGAYVRSDAYEGVPRSKNSNATGEFFLPFRVRADSFSRDGTRVVLPLGYSAVVREIATGREVSKLTVREGQDGHNDIVGSASFSPDGRFIVTTSGDRFVRLWNAATGELQHALLHGAPINSATFDAKGESLLTASDMGPDSRGGEVVVWDIASDQRKTLSPMVHEGDDVAYADFSPDGKWILSLTLKGKFAVWDAATGKQQHELDLSEGSYKNETYACDGHIGVKPVIASSPDGSTIAVLERYGKVTLLDAATLRSKPGELLKDRRFCSLAWNHDGARIAGACHDGAARVFNSSDGTLWREMPRRSDAVLSVAFDHEDRLLTAGSDKVVRVWDLRKGKEEQLQMVQVTALRGHTELVSSAVFSPNGRHILSAADDKTARIWTLPGKDALRSYSEDGLSIKDAVFSADGSSLRVLARPRTKPQIWQIRDVDLRKQGSFEGAVRILPEKFVPQHLLGGGTHAWVATPGGNAGFWHVENSRFIGSAVADSRSGNRRTVETLQSSDGNHVAMFQQGALIALNSLSGQDAASQSAPQLRFKYDEEKCVEDTGAPKGAVSHDGRQIALTCNESKVKRYVRIGAPEEEAANLMQLDLGDKIESVWFDPSGNRLAVSVEKEEREDRPVHIFELTKARKREGAILIGHTDVINTIRFNKSGTMLVTSSDDGTVRVWDTRTGRPLSLVVPPEAPKSASFDPHERHILIQMQQSVAVVDCPVCGSTADIVAEADRLLRRTVEPAASK